MTNRTLATECRHQYAGRRDKSAVDSGSFRFEELFEVGLFIRDDKGPGGRLEELLEVRCLEVIIKGGLDIGHDCRFDWFAAPGMLESMVIAVHISYKFKIHTQKELLHSGLEDRPGVINLEEWTKFSFDAVNRFHRLVIEH
jgi:hypothetical protein